MLLIIIPATHARQATKVTDTYPLKASQPSRLHVHFPVMIPPFPVVNTSRRAICEPPDK